MPEELHRFLHAAIHYAVKYIGLLPPNVGGEKWREDAREKNMTRHEFARILIKAAQFTDAVCKGVKAYTRIAPVVRRKLRSEGWP
jgi:hypothetical protein